jgi:hypothetical protein
MKGGVGAVNQIDVPVPRVDHVGVTNLWRSGHN